MVIRVGVVFVLRHCNPRGTARFNTCAAQMFFRLVVVDEQLSVLSVAARLLASVLYDVENGGCLAENGVHFLQGAVGGFRVEKVDHGDDEGVSSWR